MTGILWIGVGLALACIGAEVFIRGSVSIARRLRIPPVVVGLTVVAWGTSAPELAVSLDAAARSNPGLAVANVLGSNLFNVGFILGLAAVVCPLSVKLQLIRFDIPILVAISALLLVFYLDGRLSRSDGIVLLVSFALYSVATFYLGRKGASEEVVQEFTEAQPRRLKSILMECLAVPGGLAVLIFGGDLLVDGAVTLSRSLGVTEAVIGLTIVAAGTSLPELITSIVAAVRKEPDVAVGNIVGSNIFNAGCILGLSSTLSPIDVTGSGRDDVLAALLASVLLLPMAWSGFVLRRWEGVVLLVAYGGYIAYRWP